MYLLGAAPGVAVEAAQKLQEEMGLTVCGTDAPRVSLIAEADEDAVVAKGCRRRGRTC